MLKLRRVEIQGFKSFCDRTEMRFNGGGIAAVVGPNGCGKSNLSDAICWVLGEQSAKSLRGARMEDVIFAGTRERKPLGMASVSMVLVDPASRDHHEGAPQLPDSHPPRPQEIMVTRRLFRSGESEYLIDGRQARLRDIQDLFMGTGLGPESYAIIEQGRIGQILSSRPQDRRSVIEEAAGITRFKSKRRLAEAKLEGAKQNLTRVFDILEEVTRQVNSLKRQAAKARRFEELKTELTGHLRRCLTGRFRMLERDAAKTALDLNLATAEFERLKSEVAAGDQEQVRLQEACYQKESDLTRARGRLAELRVEAERARGRVESQARQVAGIEERLTQGEAETKELEAQEAAQVAEYQAAVETLAKVQEEAEGARRLLEERNRERERLEAGLRERERSIEAARQQVLRLLGEASTLRNQLAKAGEYLAGMERDTARARREEETSSADLERLAGQRREITEKLARRQAELDATVRDRRAVEAELAARRGRAQEARRKLEELRADASRLKARHDSLQEILSHRAYTTESVKRLFTAIDSGQARELRPMGVLADFVEVEPAYEKAAEEFLHDELEYVVVSDWRQAEMGLELMRSDLDGRATFLVHPAPDATISGSPVVEPPVGPETGILARLNDVLRLTNGLTKAPAELVPRLARCFLVDGRGTAQRLALQYPDVYFLVPDGVCYHGHAVSGGKKTGSGPLALKRELREMKVRVQARQKELEETAALAEGLDREITALSEELERLRTRQQNQEKEAIALEHDQRKLNEEHSRAQSRLSLARQELERLERETARALAQRDRDLKLAEEKESARLAQEQALTEARAELEEQRRLAARAAEEHAALRASLAGLDERCRSHRATRTRLESQLAELRNRRQDLAAEIERMGVERARLLADNLELDARAAELAGAILEAEAAVTALEADETRMRASLAALEESLRVSRAAVQEAQAQRSAVELELVRKQAELKYLDETCRKELNSPLDQIAAAEETVPDEDELAAVEQKYQEVKARIEALGPVNPQALEEYREAHQRQEFLNVQRQDLLDSIRDTEKAIHDIDIESRKRFAAAFEAINANFREIFQTLFGGGLGEMRLTDESNAGDSGIDIVAQPPGKRLQNVLLLSGGEKALTALALLMAIFRYQPSPFCILDEVDAPLDEPNIERFTRLIHEMSGQTQFIVITHAKRTMEAAEALYGVTMQEPGVSKLVSVKLKPPMSNGNGNGKGLVQSAAVA